MTRTKVAVADVFRRHGDAYREAHDASLSTAQRRAMTAIELCRTAALGGHVDQCDQCGHLHISYDSCRNRHCPTCQSRARAQWLEARQAEVLGVQYFHVVFTLPQPIAAIALQNKQTVYDLLFQAAAETLHSIAADPKHLGAKIASSPCSTPGARTSRTIHICTASCLVAALRRTAAGGFPAVPASFCRSASLPAASSICSSTACKRHSTRASCSSSAIWRRSRAGRPSCDTSALPARSTG